MNKYDEFDVTAFVQAWTVETKDISGAVSKRIDDRSSMESLFAHVMNELHSVRDQLDHLQKDNKQLLAEIRLLRSELGARRGSRLAPYSPSETQSSLSRN